MKKRKLFSPILTATLILLVYVVSSYSLINKNLSNTGRIVEGSPSLSFDVYTNSSCMEKVTMMNWGNITIGQNKTHSNYIRNEASTPMQLSMHTTDWNPSIAIQYLALTWNYQNQTIQPSNGLYINFFLYVSWDTQYVTTFSFVIIISAF